MSDFTFSATAECNKCGRYISSSDKECDHNGHTVNKHLFRRLGEGRSSMTGVLSTSMYKWVKLEEKIGEEWIEFVYIGTKDSVENMLNSSSWDSVAGLPTQSMSYEAPRPPQD